MASTFTRLTYHVVYSTKYRRPTIATDWQADLYDYIAGMIRDREGMAIQIGGMADHLHILTNLSPKLAIVDVLREIKAVSSKWINDRGLVPNRFEWQTGYGAFSVNHSQISKVQAYIQNQAEHHRTVPFRSEFLELLKKHEIEFDPRYVFEDEIIA